MEGIMKSLFHKFNKSFVNFCFSACILIIILSACGPSPEEIVEQTGQAATSTASSWTPMPKATLTPTPSPEPTAVVCTIQEDQHQEWETVLCETFDDNSYQWNVGLDPNMGIDYKINNGKYIIDFDSENSTGYTTGLALAIPFIDSKDFVLNILGEMDSNYKQCTWGIIFNGFFDTGISFDIDNQGNYYITDNNIQGDYIGNAESGSHSAIKWGEPNKITIISDSGSLLFLVNGIVISSYEYNYSGNDAISLSLWAAEGVSVTYKIDHILVREK